MKILVASSGAEKNSGFKSRLSCQKQESSRKGLTTALVLTLASHKPRKMGSVTPTEHLPRPGSCGLNGNPVSPMWKIIPPTLSPEAMGSVTWAQDLQTSQWRDWRRHQESLLAIFFSDLVFLVMWSYIKAQARAVEMLSSMCCASVRT